MIHENVLEQFDQSDRHRYQDRVIFRRQSEDSCVFVRCRFPLMEINTSIYRHVKTTCQKNSKIIKH